MSTQTGRGVDRLVRLLPLSGVAFAVLSMAGNLTIDKFPEPDTPISKLSTYYADHHAQLGRGGMLLGYSVVFMVLFGVALWSRARKVQAPTVISGALLVGTAMVGATMITGANAFLALGQIAGKPTVTPQALQAWHINASVGGFGADSVVLMLAVAAGGIPVRAFPRWLAWTALALAVLAFTPLAFFGYLLFHLWAAVVGIALTARPAGEVVAAVEPGAEAQPAYVH
ncbi:MAG TPA: hypothetical protein VF218_00160 [Acidothermaceae bacterium]|jgi:hypothetical protein